MESVANTKEVAKALAAKDWDKAFALRGPQFAHAWSTYKVVARAFPHERPDQKPQSWGVLHVGAPAPGMNASVRAVVRLGLDRGHKVLFLSLPLNSLFLWTFFRSTVSITASRVSRRWSVVRCRGRVSLVGPTSEA